MPSPFEATLENLREVRMAIGAGTWSKMSRHDVTCGAFTRGVTLQSYQRWYSCVYGLVYVSGGCASDSGWAGGLLLDCVSLGLLALLVLQ